MKGNNKMPVLFIGHGSPMNAIEENEFSLSWRNLAKNIPGPEAILCVSAHWLTEGTAVTAMARPKTIHDFYGFPKALYDVQYPARGSERHAGMVRDSLTCVKAEPDDEWGLDHGTWSVLVHMYPAADIPVLQLSLDYNLPFDRQFQAGRELARLRNQGFLIIGSGNVVHNLMMMNPAGDAYPWALEYDRFVKNCLEKKDFGPLIDFSGQKLSRQAHPTYDHYLPLLYVIGAAEDETPAFFNESVVYGSVGMRCAAYGM